MGAKVEVRHEGGGFGKSGVVDAEGLIASMLVHRRPYLDGSGGAAGLEGEGTGGELGFVPVAVAGTADLTAVVVHDASLLPLGHAVNTDVGVLIVPTVDLDEVEAERVPCVLGETSGGLGDVGAHALDAVAAADLAIGT